MIEISYQTVHQRVKEDDDNYSSMINMGYNGITLIEDEGFIGTFCMRLHVSVRSRRGSLAETFFRVSLSFSQNIVFFVEWFTYFIFAGKQISAKT